MQTECQHDNLRATCISYYETITCANISIIDDVPNALIGCVLINKCTIIVRNLYRYCIGYLHDVRIVNHQFVDTRA